MLTWDRIDYYDDNWVGMVLVVLLVMVWKKYMVESLLKPHGKL